ncbi:unknown [Prevotella sp. CAG:1058]|nr:unknown [Prevotella sp. CAG:1058]
MLRLFQGAVLHGGPCRVRQAQGDAGPAVAAPLEAFEHCPDAIISPFLAVHVTVAASLRRKFQRQAVRRLAEVQVALLRDKPEVVCRVTHHNPALLLAVVRGAQRQALRRERHGGGRCQRAPYIYVRPCRGFLGVVCSILQRVAVVLLRRDVRRLAIFDDRPVRIVEPCGHQRGVVPGFPDAHGEEDAVRLDGAAVRQFQLHHELHRVGAMRQVGRRYAERPVGRRAGDAPVLGVRAVHIAAQGLRAGTAQGVGYAEGLAACYGRGDVERATQRELHHVDAPRHLGHLHLRAVPDFHAHPHGIGAHAHILRHVHRVRAACRYVGRKRVAVCTLRYGDGHTPGVSRAFACRGVRLVVGVGQLHLVAALDGLVWRYTCEYNFRGRHAAATSACEHVGRSHFLAVLVEHREGISLVRSLADFVQP